MDQLEQMQSVAFQIIAEVGTAKSMYMEAIRIAKEEKDFDAARKMIDEGQEMATSAHSHHFEIVQKEAGGEQLPFSIMLMHAEDQLLTTEVIKMMAIEVIDLHEQLNK